MRCSFVKCSLQYPYCFKIVRFVLSGETYFWNNIVVLESNKQYIVKLKSHWRLKLIIPNNKYICILWYLMSDLILIFCLPLKHTLYSFKSQIFFLVYSKMCFKFLEGKALGKEGSCIFKTWFYKLICISLNFFFANLVENITWNFKGTAWSIQNLHLQLRWNNLLFHNFFWLCGLRRQHLLTVTVLFASFNEGTQWGSGVSPVLQHLEHKEGFVKARTLSVIKRMTG